MTPEHDSHLDEVGEQTIDSTEEAEESRTEEVPERARGTVSGWMRRWRAKIAAIVLALLVAATSALAGGLFYFQYRPDQQTDAAAKVVVRAATDGTTALLSYSPDTVDRDFAAAKSHLTGNFLTYYSEFTEKIVTPAAKQRGVKTTASVVRAAVSDLHPDSAVVLVFVNQTTTSTQRPEPAAAASSVIVTLTKVKGAWLISKFEPV